MKTKLPVILFGLAMLLAGFAKAATTAKAPDPALPEAYVKAFYKYHFAHDMAFTAEELEHRAAWLTPDLVKLCRAYFALPEDPDEAPDIEGDMFTGSQEYPDTYSTSAAVIDGSVAHVPVTFTWKDHHSTKGVVVMKNMNGKWLIDDMEYPGQESMRQTLQYQFTQTQSAPSKQ